MLNQSMPTSDRPDAHVLRGLRAADLVVLALLRAGESNTGELADRAAVSAWRVLLALLRLKRRGLVETRTHRAARDTYVATDVGVRLGPAGLAALVLADAKAISSHEFVADRLGRLGARADRSILGPGEALRGHETEIPILAELARTGSQDERALAVRALGALRTSEAGPTLVSVLEEDDDENIRCDAARALARTGGEEAGRALRNAAGRGSSVQRAAVAEALGRLGHPAAFDELVALTKMRSAPVRSAAVRALGQIGDHRAVPVVADALTDDDRRTRSRARAAMTRLNGQEAVEALRQNAARALPFRRTDVRKADRALRMATHPSRGSVERPHVDPLSDHVTGIVGTSALAGLVIVVGALILDVRPWIVLPLALIVAWSIRRLLDDVDQAEEALDFALARTERLPDTAKTASRAWRWLRVPRFVFVTHTVLIALALGAEWSIGSLGLIPGVIGGLEFGWVAAGILRRQSVLAWEAREKTKLYTETIRALLPGRRFFTR